MGRYNAGYLLVLLMLLLVTDVDGRRSGGRSVRYYRSGYYYGGGSTGGASTGGLNSGAIIGIVTGVIGIGICMRYFPLWGQM